MLAATFVKAVDSDINSVSALFSETMLGKNSLKFSLRFFSTDLVLKTPRWYIL